MTFAVAYAFDEFLKNVCMHVTLLKIHSKCERILQMKLYNLTLINNHGHGLLPKISIKENKQNSTNFLTLIHYNLTSSIFNNYNKKCILHYG